jgi:hypothetical protein
MDIVKNEVSCQKMGILNNLQHKVSLSRDAMIYINRYHSTYKRVISEAKKDIMTNKQWVQQT